jgi:nucleoside-diphosphate-sugar epimerase
LRGLLNPACPEEHGPAMIGEQLRSVITSAKIQRELGWSPNIGLSEGLKMTAEYFKGRFA